ncbi:MAG: trehalose-phosphatase [Chloroflexi bacterium]|nr:trehalose-phosphatase [Chloroflexota bacterium]
MAALGACLEALKSAPRALIVDLDGTISPIAPDPESAFVLPGCRDALDVLSEHFDLVGVLTGRRPLEARDLVGLDSVEYWGVHGMVHLSDGVERIAAEALPFVAILDSIRAVVEAHDLWEGMWVEAKGPSLGVHYRKTAKLNDARAWLLTTLRPLAVEHHLEVLEGRMVVELRPPGLGKGWCITSVARDRGLHALVYLGDDRTDAEAFQAMRRWERAGPDRHGVAVAVVSTEVPRDWAAGADHVVDDVSAVERLLQGLAHQVSG